MKGFIRFVGVVGLIAAGVADALNNFTNPGPSGNTVIQAGGGATTFSWQPDPEEPTISLVLKNAQQTIVLLNQQPNTGSFVWTVPLNLPSGSYVLEIGSGSPDALTGTSTSAQFTVQPCETCSSVASTALYTSSGATIMNSGTATAEATATGSLSGHATVTQSGTTLVTSMTAASETGASSVASLTQGTASVSGSSATKTPSSGAVANAETGRWMGIFVAMTAVVLLAGRF